MTGLNGWIDGYKKQGVEGNWGKVCGCDTDGLYLYVAEKGTKIWRLRLQKEGKETTSTIGRYPVLKLADARFERNEILRALAKRETTGYEKQAKRGPSFEEVTEQWIQKNKAE